MTIEEATTLVALVSAGSTPRETALALLTHDEYKQWAERRKHNPSYYGEKYFDMRCGHIADIIAARKVTQLCDTEDNQP